MIYFSVPWPNKAVFWTTISCVYHINICNSLSQLKEWPIITERLILGKWGVQFAVGEPKRKRPFQRYNFSSMGLLYRSEHEQIYLYVIRIEMILNNIVKLQSLYYEAGEALARTRIIPFLLLISCTGLTILWIKFTVYSIKSSRAKSNHAQALWCGRYQLNNASVWCQLKLWYFLISNWKKWLFLMWIERLIVSDTNWKNDRFWY